jgi:hypothetical protein
MRKQLLTLVPVLAILVLWHGTGVRSVIASADGLPGATFGSTIGMHAGVTGLGLSDLDMQQMQAAGVEYVRVRMSWGAEVEKTVGAYTWGPHDNLFNKLETYGIKPLVVITHTHSGYNTNSITMDEVAERQGFANFAAAAVARYDEPGFIWEIWNEQNAANFWSASTSGNTTTNARERAQNYMGLLDLAVPAMRNQSSTVKIISGGVLDVGWNVTQAWHDEAMNLGLLDRVDGLGIHTYGGNQNSQPELHLISDINNLRFSIVTHGGSADFPILNTEFGVNSDTELSGSTAEKLHEQASIYTRSYLMSALVGLRLDVRYQWQQAGAGDDVYAVVNTSNGIRPAYTATAVVAGELGDYTFSERLAIGSGSDYLLLFENGPYRKLAGWTTASDHNLVIPVETNESLLDVISMLGSQSALSVENGQITFALTSDPQYVDLGAIEVPEPLSAVLLSLAAGYLAVVRRRSSTLR